MERRRSSASAGAACLRKNSINAGATLKLSDRLGVNAAYYYAPQTEVNGPIQLPGGPVPGSNVNYRIAAHAISVGMTVLF